MIELLEDIWVITETGIACWNLKQNSFIRDQYMGMIMCALNILAKRVTQKELHNFEVGNNRFYVLRKASLIFAAMSDKDVDEELATKELDNISNKFINYYPKEIFTNWDNDISVFSDFSQYI